VPHPPAHTIRLVRGRDRTRQFWNASGPSGWSCHPHGLGAFAGRGAL